MCVLTGWHNGGLSILLQHRHHEPMYVHISHQPLYETMVILYTLYPAVISCRHTSRAPTRAAACRGLYPPPRCPSPLSWPLSRVWTLPTRPQAAAQPRGARPRAVTTMADLASCGSGHTSSNSNRGLRLPTLSENPLTCLSRRVNMEVSFLMAA